jgi:FAD/FMN-containing dehydrogenase
VQTHASQPGQFIGIEFNSNRGTFYHGQTQGFTGQYRTIDLMPEENYMSKEQMTVLRALKKHFDPNNIMNPGEVLRLD